MLSSFAAYALEKKIAKDPSRFGKGAVEGVAAPESANNAGAQASFIPLLTLGIPSNAIIALMAAGLKACGVSVTEEPEGFTVVGGPVRGGAGVTTHGDHRIAMSHLVLGLAAERAVTVDEPGMIATSFPGFMQLMQGLGARIEAG